MDESNTTYEVTIVPPGWSHSFAKSGNLMVLILLPNVFFLMKNHHDVSFHQMFIYFCFFFLRFFDRFSSKCGSAGASLVQVCCKLAPLVCNFDASLMLVYSLVLV